MNEIIHKNTQIEDVETISDRVLKFTISTETVDRDYDKILLAGWKTDNFLKKSCGIVVS